MSKNKSHTVAVSNCTEILIRAVSREWVVRSQDPITLFDGEPEPDVVIARRESNLDPENHPTPKDIGLVIEVSDTSLCRDRGIKLRSYARAGIEHYWIINLTDRVIELYSHPKTDVPEPTYASRQIIPPAESITLPAAIGGPSIRAADLLP